jgi:GTP-dependent dephospho-CoA kinase
MRIPEKVRKELKHPLGELHIDFRKIKKLSTTMRVISIGDVCTLGLLAMGIRPHLAVFDHRYMRNKLAPGFVKILKLNYPNPLKMSNPPGTLSEEIVKNAKNLIENGGAILIEGEEDLTALAFIKSAGKNDLIVYGQPNEGMVVVISNENIKKKIERWLAAAVSLGHEV